MKRRFTVTVFAGSALSTPLRFQKIAFKLGELISKKGWIMKNGAGKCPSLMGRSTDGALQNGGAVKGVIIKRFLHLKHKRLKNVSVYQTLCQRKRELLKADAFVVVPGGFGTLDEFTEVLTSKQAGLKSQPVIILNCYGFYDGLLGWFGNKLLANRFILKKHLKLFKVVDNVEAAITILSRHQKQVMPPNHL